MHFMHKQCVLITIGVCLIGSGVIFAIFWMDIFQAILAKELSLKPNTKSFEMWKKPPLTLHFDIYLYNWTNPTAFTANDYEKPILKQLGPYRFREIGVKTKINWHPKNSTISYRKRATYYFDADGSVGRLDDEITTINAVAISAANAARNWEFLFQKQVSFVLRFYNQRIFITKKAGELLFDGYQDDMIDMARIMPNFGPYSFDTPPFDRFGWFYGRNESDEFTGHFNIKTGVDDIFELGHAKTFNHQTETGFYDKHCDRVRGSAGEFFPPGQTTAKPITFYHGELCRYFNLYYTDTLNVNGLRAYKYSATERSMDNGTKYNESVCFSTLGQSVASGLMNVSACRYGAPGFISLPHFYAADPIYLTYVDGMKPSKMDHEFYIALEPTTGIPVDVAARLQINLHIQQFPNIELYKEAPDFFFPILWFEQRVRMPDEIIANLRLVTLMPDIGYICVAIIVGIGAILLIWIYCQHGRLSSLHARDIDTKDVSGDAMVNQIDAEHSPLMKSKQPITDFEIMPDRLFA